MYKLNSEVNKQINSRWTLNWTGHPHPFHFTWRFFKMTILHVVQYLFFYIDQKKSIAKIHMYGFFLITDKLFDGLI